jgi:hypothetical protein
MAHHRLPLPLRLIPLLIGLIGLPLAVPLLAAPAHLSAVRHAPSALGQPAGLTMRVRAAYDGHYKVGEWFPVQVDLSNDGTGTVAGQVQVVAKNDSGGDGTTYVRDIELPAPSHKQVTLTTFAATYARSFDVRLVSGSNTLLSQTVSVEPVEYPAFLLGVVSADTGLLNVLNGESLGTLGDGVGSTAPGGTVAASRVTVAHLQPGDLPANAAALAGLDALILAGTDTSNLPGEVHAALAGWVVRGGTLVVAGSGTTPAGLSDLLPVQVTGTRQAADFTALSAYSAITSPLTSAGPVLVAAAAPAGDRNARVLASDAAGPLLAERSYGAGTVLFLALDPAQPPLQGWRGTLPLWQRALSTTSVELSMAAGRRLHSYSGYGYGSDGNPLSAGVELPNAWLVGGFLLAYILLVGPVNYLVLRARKQVELAWVTIPVLIALFVLGAYLLGVATRGTDARLIQSSLIRVYDNVPQATVDSFVGLLSPDRRTNDLTFTGDLPLTELDPSSQGLAHGNPAAIVQGRPSAVRNLPLDTWALRGFLAESTVAYADPFSTTLHLENGHIVGQVINRGADTLRDVGVLYGNGAAPVGDLAPGATAAVDLTLSSGNDQRVLIERLIPGATGSGTPPRALTRRIGLLTTLLPLLGQETAAGTVQAQVIGWTDAAPLDARVPGRQVRLENTTLVAGSAPVGLPQGAWTLPRYLVGWQVVAGSALSNYGPYGPGQLTFRLDTSPVVFQFVLPSGFRATALAIGCELSAYSGFFNVQPALYNWTTGQFDPVLVNGQPQIINNTVNGGYASATIAVPSPVAPYLGPRGEVNLQLSQQNSFDEIQLQDLYISGSGE